MAAKRGEGFIIINGKMYGAGTSEVLDAQSTNLEAAGAKATYDELVKKVDKVEGKGLSTEDFTTEEKTKLSGLENTIVDAVLNSTSTNPVQNKVIYEALQSATSGAVTIVDSELSDSSENPVQNKVIKAALDEKAIASDVTAALAEKADAAATTEALAGKVDKVDGKGLSTNDYTTAEKNKLAGLSNTVVDSALSATSTNPVQNKIVTTALNGKAASSHTHNYAGSSSAGGVATSAAKLATARTIALSGDVSGSTTFDGSGNASIETALAKEITVNELYIGSQKAQIYESSTGPTSYSLYIQPAKNESIYLANGSHYTIAGYSTSRGVILGEMSKALDLGIYGKTIKVDGPVTFKSDITCANLTATSGITAPGASYSTLGLVKLNDYTTITDSTGFALPATEKNPNISGSLANQISHLNTDCKLLACFYYDEKNGRSADFTIDDITNYKFIFITLKYGDVIYDSVTLPTCLIHICSGVKLYREGSITGVVTFNSNTSVTIEQPNLDYSPVEIYGIK